MIGFEIPLSAIQSTFLVFLRILSISLALPFLRKRIFPGLIAIFALVLAMIAVNLLDPLQRVFINSLTVFVFGAIQEVLIGGLIGFLVSLALGAVQFAGQIVGFQMGFVMGAVIDPISGEQESPLSQFYSLLSGMLFLAIDGHLIILNALMESLKALPPLFSYVDPQAVKGLFFMFTHIFVVAIKIAAPVLAVSILTTISFAISARLAPQLNIFFVLLPFKILLGLFALMFSLSVMSVVARDHYWKILDMALSILKGV